MLVAAAGLLDHDWTGHGPDVMVELMTWIKRGSWLPPQLDQPENLIGGRIPDAIVVSIGGNDAGFGNSIATSEPLWVHLLKRRAATPRTSEW